MAKIPTADSLGVVGIRSDRPMAQIDRHAAAAMRAPAAAMADFGQAALNLGDTVAKKQQEAEDYEIEKRFIDFDLAQEKALDEAQRSAPPDGAGFTTSYRSNYDTAAREFFKDVPDRLKQKYDHRLVRRAADYEKRAHDFELRQSDSFHQDDVNTRLLDLHTATQTNPDRYRENIARGISLIDSSRLSPAAKHKLRRAYAADVEEYAIRGRIDRDDLDGVIRDLQRLPKVETPQGSSAGIERHSDGMATVSVGSGARFRVGGDYADRFAGALADLEAAGVEIKGDQSGGYANRNIRGTNKRSEHSFGRAIDINWNENAQGTKGAIDPDLARSIAKKWGLKWGGDFKNPDPMHFEIDPKAKPEARAVQAAERGGERSEEMEGASDIPAGDPDAPYRHLTPKQRSTLLNLARTARSAITQQEVNDDIERIRRTGEAPTGADGRTSIDRARRSLTRNQYETLQLRWDEARMEHEAISPLRSLSELEDESGGSEVDRHFAGLSPDEKLPEESYASRARVMDKASAAWKKIQEERRKDPALAVNHMPEVRQAFAAAGRAIPNVGIVQNENGELEISASAAPAVNAQRAQEMVIEARLEAQRKLGIPDVYRSPITRAQAEKLLDMPDPSLLDDKSFYEKLRAASDRAEATYGPRYGRQAFEFAVRFKLREKDQKEVAAGLISKMVRGEPVTQRDISRVNTLDEIAAMDSVFSDRFLPSFAMQEAARPFISPQFGREAMASIQEFAARESNRKPTKAQEQWLQDNPDQWQLFDSRFGRGAAARVLEKQPPK